MAKSLQQLTRLIGPRVTLISRPLTTSSKLAMIPSPAILPKTDENLKKFLELQPKLLAAITPPPPQPSNPHFGVGPIMRPKAATEREQIEWEFSFAEWVKKRYKIAIGDQKQSMHRTAEGLDATKDFLKTFHEFIGSPPHDIGITLGGGYGGYSAMTANILNPAKKVYIDTPDPRTVSAGEVGAFRHKWASDLLSRYEAVGCSNNIIFSTKELSGEIPNLSQMGINFFVGVANETTGCTKYNEKDISNLTSWVDSNPNHHHAILDVTSLLGSMELPLDRVNFFTPPQKAAAGTAEKAILGIRPQTKEYIKTFIPPWHIEATFDIAPINPTTKLRQLNPFFSLVENRTGPVINTINIAALMEATYALKSMMAQIGGIKVITERSKANLKAIEQLIEGESALYGDIFELPIEDKSRRSAATTLLVIKDADLTESQRAQAVTLAKSYLGNGGLVLHNEVKIEGLNAADNLNTYPGTPGDFRFWMGGVRDISDVEKLLGCIKYAYTIAKTVLIEEELKKSGIAVPYSVHNKVQPQEIKVEIKKPPRNPQIEVIKGIIVDPIGLIRDENGNPDIREAKAYIEAKGWILHEGPIDPSESRPGIHISYQPNITPDGIIGQTSKGEYDIIIAAAKLVPPTAKIKIGVRMGAGVNNMQFDGIVMNTPGQNARITAQSLFHALLNKTIPLESINTRTATGELDTSKILQLGNTGLQGRTIAILGITGDVGGEVMKLAKSFGMKVIGWGRNFTLEQAKSLGITYAKTPEQAVANADIISPHVTLNDQTKGIIGKSIFEVMKPNATLINFGRGELVNPIEAENFLQGKYAPSDNEAEYKRKLMKARIITDADVFKDGRPSPLDPYLTLAQSYPQQVINYPHIAADCDHITRVSACKQAVDQVSNAILHSVLVNYTGNNNRSSGYINGSKQKPSGIGLITNAEIQAVVSNEGTSLAQAAQTIVAILGCGNSPAEMAKRVGQDSNSEDFIKALNILSKGNLTGRLFNSQGVGL